MRPFSSPGRDALRTFPFTWLFVATTLTGCSPTTPAAPQRAVDVQVVLAPGETAEITNAQVRVRFVGVTGDSRCPADVVCIQGGDAVVRIDVLPSGGDQASYDLHTGNLQPVRYADFTIALVELTPYPFSSRPIAPSEYRAKLRITRQTS